MKMIASLFALLTSLSSFACVDISGKYLCPEEAADEFALGTREVQFKKSPIAEIYSMKLGKKASIYQVDAWNPDMNPTTGDIDFTTETMAECKDGYVLLNSRITEEELGMTMQGSYKITPTREGISLRVLVENEEFYHFDCQKI